MMFGFFPPSSSATLFTVAAPAAMMALPVATPPVNETMSTLSSVVSTLPTSGPLPVTRLATPGGTPASVSVSINMIAVDGVSSLGFSTNVFPASKAGATFHDTCRSG